VVEITVSLLQSALSARDRWKVSYWDAAIVEAALAAGCAVLLSEDLQHGMDFAGVKVVDPSRPESSRTGAPSR
jgi:predicted nucleic acid-binding protein